MALNLTPEQQEIFDRVVGIVRQFVRRKTKIIPTLHRVLPATLLCASLMLGAQQTFAQTKTTDTTSQTILSDKALFSLAFQAQNAGNTTKAIELYTQAIALNPNYADTYYNRGNEYYHLKEYEAAIKDYNQAIALDPKNAKMYFNRGVVQYEVKNYEAAIKDYNQAITLDPKNARMYLNRGAVYYEINNYKEAIRDYNQVVYLDEKYKQIYRNRGAVHYEMSNYEAAIKDYSQAIIFEPTNAEMYKLRASSYALSGNLTAAQVDARRACDLGDCELFKVLNKVDSNE